MGNPISKSQLAAGFEQLIYREDYAGFFRALDQLHASSDMWERLQIRSIDILIHQGFAFKALEKALFLKHSLTNPVLRRYAELKHLYLDLIVNRKAQSSELETKCQATLNDREYASLHLSIKYLILQLSATRLMLGLLDARKKRVIVRKYIAHINAYCTEQRLEEAYTSTLELIKLLLSSPLPMRQKALTYLHYYRSRPFITSAPHRIASLDLLIAEIRFEDHLRGDRNKAYQKHYSQAATAFDQISHTVGKLYIQKSQGQILLKYGKTRGWQLLNDVVRGFEAKNRLTLSLDVCMSIIQWLEIRGEQSALRNYRIKVNEIRESNLLGPRQKPRSQSATDLSEKADYNDLFRDSNQVIAQAQELSVTGNHHKSISVLDRFILTAEQKGETLHLARVLGYLANISGHSMDSFCKSKSDRAIALFTKLGHPMEAVEVIRQRSLQLGQLAKIPSRFAEAIKLLQADVTQAESILQSQFDLESRQALASYYQAVAYIWMSLGLAEKGIEILKNAENILKKHGLVEKLAFNELYLGCLFLEMSDDQKNNRFCHEAQNRFSEAHQLFKVMNNYEGSWRSQFGIALSSHKRVTLSAQKAPLLTRDCAENYIKSIEAVHRLTIHHLKTGKRFGGPFVFCTRLQKGADQLYASAIDFFVNIAHDQPVARSLQGQKRLWTILNKSNHELKMN